jgi:hypothetical protein
VITYSVSTVVIYDVLYALRIFGLGKKLAASVFGQPAKFTKSVFVSRRARVR